MSNSPAAESSRAAAASSAAPNAVEFEPPLACVRRILKNTLPSSTNVGKDASAAFARACGIFVIYITACANDVARENKRQTITANDVLAAVKELDFEEFTPHLKEFLERHRAAEKSKKDAKAKAAADAKRSAEDVANEEHGDDDSQEDNEPEAKRAKVETSTSAASGGTEVSVDDDTKDPEGKRASATENASKEAVNASDESPSKPDAAVETAVIQEKESRKEEPVPMEEKNEEIQF